VGAAFVVSPELAGQRLDRALTRLFPQMGLRGNRRAIAAGLALRNGRAEKASCRLRAGDRLEVLERAPFAAARPRFLSRRGEYVFVDKPAGLHCAGLAGGADPGLEGFLPEILPPECGGARLLQRLDCETSGIVCAALNSRAVAAFRAAEREGRCEKRYLAVLLGVLPQKAIVRLGLDTARRRKSRLLSSEGDETRWTEFRPLRHFDTARAGFLSAPAEISPDAPARSLTLAACRIRRGARHQIRAHAAALGHPLWGDGLYGTPADSREPPLRRSAFFLHHGMISFPGGRCSLPPPWPLPEAFAGPARQWLEPGADPLYDCLNFQSNFK
jgi:23S rRNA pseudouridine1911/1915/1917 synthase